MTLNQTLLGQMITFGCFVWFTMRFIWPVLAQTLKARQEKIAEGLLAAERGHKELALSQKYATQHMQEARTKALEMIEKAKKEAIIIIEQAKAEATHEKDLIVAAGIAEVQQATEEARESIKDELVSLTVCATEQLLGRVMDSKDHQTLLKITSSVDHKKGRGSAHA